MAITETRDGAKISRPLQVVFLIWTIAGIGLAIYYIFGFSVRGYSMFDRAYYYLLFVFFLSPAFIIMRARKTDRAIRWYDLVFAALTSGICFYFFLQARWIADSGWSSLPQFYFVLALILCLLVLEAARRMAGPIYVGVVVVVGLYPVFAAHMPGMFYGFGSPLPRAVSSYAFGSEGLLGIPTKVMGDILIPYLIFAGILTASGAGKFFLNLALCTLGCYRGGAAKVSAFASALFGTLSGSAIANVVSTGAFTIPAMKRTGYAANYAGAIEAVASTGGMLMPPVMGATAFVMAAFISVPYAAVATAAIIPAILYYYGLLLQIDAYAARVGLKGLTREEIPSLKRTLAEGWPFLVVVIFLIWGLFWMRWDAMAAFYAAALMFLLSFYRKETMMSPRRFIESLFTVGRLIVQTMAVMTPVGIIVGGLVQTGSVSSFTATIINVGGGNLYLILFMGVIACYVMGMAGLITPAYIFLALSLAPAVIKVGGLDPLAVHLFIVYYSSLGGFTPPVATAAFVAAAIAGAPPMKTAITAMRLGVVIYLIPFVFIFAPAMILKGSILDTVYILLFCLVGIAVIAGGLEGYLWRVGRLSTWSRTILVIAGFLITLPELGLMSPIVGAALTVLVIAAVKLRKYLTVPRSQPSE